MPTDHHAERYETGDGLIELREDDTPTLCTLFFNLGLAMGELRASTERLSEEMRRMKERYAEDHPLQDDE